MVVVRVPRHLTEKYLADRLLIDSPNVDQMMGCEQEILLNKWLSAKWLSAKWLSAKWLLSKWLLSKWLLASGCWPSGCQLSGCWPVAVG
jgi:hypothetical protein